MATRGRVCATGRLAGKGGDFPERLEEEGFEVTVDGWVRTLDAATLERYGLFPLEDIYVARRPRKT